MEFIEELRQFITMMYLLGIIVICLYGAAWLVYKALGCEYLMHDDGEDGDDE